MIARRLLTSAALIVIMILTIYVLVLIGDQLLTTY